MKFKSQICTTKEQSQRLLALGLKRETADMVILEHPRKEGRYFYIAKEDANWEGFPAWSLHRLIELYKSVEDTSLWSLDCVNYDRLIQCIGLAIKHGDFNKEYLEE